MAEDGKDQDLRETIEQAVAGRLEDIERRKDVENAYNEAEELQAMASDRKSKKKPKPLRDNRPQARKVDYYCPTEEEALALADKYGFKSDYSLREKLEDAYSTEETHRCLSEDTTGIGEQRELLKALRDRCQALEEVVTKLGLEERMRLKVACSERLNHEPIDLNHYKAVTHMLYNKALGALSQISGKRGARQREENIWNFVWFLADVWQIGTEKKPTCNYDGAQERFVGDFYQFVCECAELGSVQLSGSNSPGSTIRSILKERRDRQNSDK